MANISFKNPDFEHLGHNLKAAAALRLPLVRPDCHQGEPGAVVVGLGPSIQNQTVRRQLRHLADAGFTFIGIKEALLYLRDLEIPTRYAINMDPGDREADRTPIVAGVQYCVANTCSPVLFRKLLAARAEVLIYFSASGAQDYEMVPGFVLELPPVDKAIVLGQFTFATAGQAFFCPVSNKVLDEVELVRRYFGVENAHFLGNGFTVGNRGVMLARWMGFPQVYAAGLDFGWRRDRYYADFVKAPPVNDDVMEDGGRIDGTPWLTKADLLGSAVEMARLIQAGKVEIIGDSLAASLAKHDMAFIESRVAQIVNEDATPVHTPAPAPTARPMAAVTGE